MKNERKIEFFFFFQPYSLEKLICYQNTPSREKKHIFLNPKLEIEIILDNDIPSQKHSLSWLSTKSLNWLNKEEEEMRQVN